MFKALISLFLFLLISQSYAAQHLVFSIDIVRHGDRTPISASSAMKKIWPGDGQLTPLGMRQEFELGVQLRKQYIEQDHFLPTIYDMNAINVRSSGIPRTMMSAQSLLLGLYPLGTGPLLEGEGDALPQGFQPIPIYTVPIDQDSLLVPHYNKQRFTQLLEAYILNTVEWKEKEAEVMPYFSKWSDSIGISIQHLFDLILVSDRLMIEQQYGIPLPLGLSEQEAAQIQEIGKWAWLQIVNHPKLALAGGYELAQTIEQELNSAKDSSHPLKYLLYLAHDSTIAAQLQLLDQVIDEIPPYTSRLNFSLLSQDNKSYEVKVMLNDKPLWLKCGGYSCSLEKFIQMMNQRLGKLD